MVKVCVGGGKQDRGFGSLYSCFGWIGWYLTDHQWKVKQSHLLGSWGEVGEGSEYIMICQLGNLFRGVKPSENIPQIYTYSVISSNQGASWRLCSYDCSYGKIEVRCKCIATINKCGGTFLSITPRRQRDPWVPDNGDWFAHRSPQLDLIYVDNWRHK